MENNTLNSKEQEHAAGESRKNRGVKKYDLDEILQGMEDYPKEDVIDRGEPVGREVW